MNTRPVRNPGSIWRHHQLSKLEHHCLVVDPPAGEIHPRLIVIVDNRKSVLGKLVKGRLELGTGQGDRIAVLRVGII